MTEKTRKKKENQEKIAQNYGDKTITPTNNVLVSVTKS